MGFKLSMFGLIVLFCALLVNDSVESETVEAKHPVKANNGAPLMFADELKQTLERYLFGMCPQTYKIKEKFFFFGYSCISGAAHGGPGHCTGRLTQKARNLNRISLNGGVLVIMLKYISEHTPLGGKPKNATTVSCDLDVEQQDLAGRLAALALHAHSAGRGDCSRLGVALANTFGELARTAASRHALNTAASSEANKKRKLSKSQKAKIQAKQRTALAVKKKAAALAAAAAAKISVAA